jgi:hypothetical protein
MDMRAPTSPDERREQPSQEFRDDRSIDLERILYDPEYRQEMREALSAAAPEPTKGREPT